MAERLEARPGPDPDWNLTKREKEVLALLEAGLSNVEIAAKLSISVPTVKSHLQSIYRKAGEHNWVKRPRRAWEYVPG